MTAPAGWMPDPENPGQLRYWDGERWTEHRAPDNSQSAMATPVPGAAPPRKRNGPLIGVLACVGLAVLALIGGALGGGDDDEPESATVVSTEATTTSGRTATTSERATTSTQPTTTTTTTTAPPATTTTAPPTTTTTEPPGPSLTVSQQSAVQAAESYLRTIGGFSRQGLIDQLSSEYGNQFSVEDATVAVDSMNIDYDAQAVEAAESYMETIGGFSCQGMIDQLSSEYGNQFNIEQARHGATQVGLC